MLLVVSSGASWLVAFVAGLATAVVLGALVEILVIRRFTRSPRLVLTVATIGLAQVLAGLGLLLPRWFDVAIPPQSYPAPVDWHFTVDPDHAWMMNWDPAAPQTAAHVEALG